jgi:hypothetical protein
MGLKRPLMKKQIENASDELEKARNEFIRGGGFVSSDVKKKESKDDWSRIVIRIKEEAVMQIDALIGNTMGLTRTGWILQAIEEKFDKYETNKF